MEIAVSEINHYQRVFLHKLNEIYQLRFDQQAINFNQLLNDDMLLVRFADDFYQAYEKFELSLPEEVLDETKYLQIDRVCFMLFRV